MGAELCDIFDPALPTRMLAEPSRAMAPINPADPACLGYPPTFPIELALHTAPTPAILAEYDISDEEWEQLKQHPTFLADLKRAMDMVQQEGMSFRLKAKLQAEELLKTSWRMIHDPASPANVRADLVKATMRWAQYDTPAANGVGAGGTSLQINFVMG
jgi:hypothetical protein